MLAIVENPDTAQWDARLRDLGGNIYHTTAWADYILAGDPNAAPRYMTLLADGRSVGMALGFQNRSRRRLLAPFTARLSLDAFPVVVDGNDRLLEQFFRHLLAHAQTVGCLELQVGSFASGGGGQQLSDLGFALTRRFEFELDLEASEDALWNGMEYKRRKNIRKAERGGVVLADLDADSGIAELRRLQGASSERIVARGGPDIAYRSKNTGDPVGVLLNRGLGRIIGAKVDGEVVSASLFTHFNGLVYHTLSGHGEVALRTQAPTYLLWEAVKRYKSEGARRFNLGGCHASAADEGDSSHGIYVYKMGFGGRRFDCNSGRKVLRNAVHATMRTMKRLMGR